MNFHSLNGPRTARMLFDMIEKLIAWEQAEGGFKNPVWREARDLVSVIAPAIEFNEQNPSAARVALDALYEIMDADKAKTVDGLMGIARAAIDAACDSPDCDVIAATAPAKHKDVLKLLRAAEETGNGRSKFFWARKVNGDLFLGVYPQGDTYEDITQTGKGVGI